MQTNALRRPSFFDKILAQPAANDVHDELPAEDEHLEMVRRIAGAMVRHLPPHVDKDELLSLGYMGLVEAQQRFDPSRGVPFGAFAAMRVRGAMLDWLRQIDPVSRNERARLRTTNEAASVTLIDFSSAENHAMSDSRDAVEELLQHERRVLLGRALDQLSDRERLVVTRYFFEDRLLKEIGDELKVTESRVSQIITAVVKRLRTVFAEMEGAIDEAA